MDIINKLKETQVTHLNEEDLRQVNNLLVEVDLAVDRVMMQKKVINNAVKKINDILKKP